MSVVEHPAARPAPGPKRWTLAEYAGLVESGVLAGHQLHLLDGELFDMGFQGLPHSRSSERVSAALQRFFGPGFWVREQKPLLLGLDTDPEPDGYVAAGDPQSFNRHPADAVLVVEVSDTTLRHDRITKAALYARAGIADYWIVNLVDRQLEIRRRPIKDDAAPGGFRYAELTVLKPGEFASPLAAPEGRIAVADLLP